MGATSHGLQKALLSLLVPLMVTGGLGNLTTVHAATTGVPVTAPSQPDKYRTALSEPGFQTAQRQYRRDIPVQFLGINDLHGGLDNTGTAWINNVKYDGVGHVSRLAAYLNQAQRQFLRVHHSLDTFRLQAGDMVGASPANSSLLAHEPTMHALRAMHFQLGTLGNHEFDRGLGEFNRILTGGRPGADADSVVKRYPHRATRMQEVVSNVVRKSDGKQPYGYQPYVIRTVRAHGRSAKIGFIGIETTDLPNLTYPRNYQDYRVLDEAETIAKYDKLLNKKGVKAVVVMAHTGAGTWKGKTSGDAVNILQKVNRIDPDNNVGLYLAAHSHQYANAVVGKTRIVQALSSSRAYDDTQGYINPRTGKFSTLETHVYPVLSAQDDPLTKTNRRVDRIVRDANRRVAGKINAVIGTAATTAAIDQTSDQNGESPVGELVVDGQLYEAKRKGQPADFALTNTGGVRSKLVVDGQKHITWGAAQAVQPFGNVLQIIEMTGQQVVDALNKQYSANGALQVAGLRYTYTGKGQQARVVRVTKTDGTPLDLQAKYRVVINDFLHSNAKYGFVGTPVVGSLASDTDVFVQYIQDMQAAGKTIAAPKAGRKTLQPTATPATSLTVAPVTTPAA